jgi:NAD(P)-dependent dehydrogenase (short-subunit alcohol dehydrogenase family)
VARLQDKIALVVGAGSSGPGWGNGKAAAVAFAREGARVVALDVDIGRAEETRDIIKEEGGEAIAVAANVTKSAEIKAAVDKTVEVFGSVDILHYNVGIGDFGGPVELSEKEWDLTFDVNLKGAFLSCKHVLPIMERQHSGVITTISSIAGLGIGPYPYIAYSASKAALNHFTKAVAVAYAGKGIRANSLLPGAMNTPMIYSQPQMVEHYGSIEEMVKARDALTPMGKMGDAWDIASAAVFLASDEAKYISGVVLPVDGCLSCKMG